jgi:hypothetical protein
MRENLVDHRKYNASLDSMQSRKLYKGIYNVNEKETQQDGTQLCVDKIVSNKNFMNTTVRVCDLYKVETYEEKQERLEKLLQKLSPTTERTPSLMKQLMHQVVVLDGETLLTPKKRVKVNEYVQNKMPFLRPDPTKAFDLFLNRIEKEEGYTPPNFRKDLEEEEIRREKLKKEKLN